MALRVFIFFLCAVVSSGAVAAGGPNCEGDTRTDDERLTELMSVQNQYDHSSGGFDGLVEQVTESFRSLWCAEAYRAGLKSASDAQVEIRLRAARTAAFYDREDWILERLRSVVDAAHARGLATLEDINTLFTALQVAGRYEAARRVRASYPEMELPEVPRLVEPTAPRPEFGRKVWHVDGEDNRLRGDWLALSGVRLLVVTSPGCGYCRAAAEELAADEVLAPLMGDHAVWLAERSMNNTFRSIAWWNDRYADTPTLLVDDPNEWPIPDFRFTPRFHFIREGEIVHTLAGWRGGPEGMSAIADGFDRLGLLDTSQLPEDVFAYAEKPSPTRGCPERDVAREQIRETAPIRTREDLDRHLASLEAGADSPLHMLSSEGRKRFIASMRFRDDGSLMGFGYGELKAQLEPHEIYRVTSLFGEQYLYAGRLFDPDLLSQEERSLRAMLHCET